MAYEAVNSHHSVIVKLRQVLASHGAIEKPMPEITSDLKYTRAQRKTAMEAWADGGVQHEYRFDAAKGVKSKNLDQLVADYSSRAKGISHYYVWFDICPGTTIVRLEVFLWDRNPVKEKDDAKSDAA
jgi:hypothetical protein